MLSEPTITTRPPQPYAAIRITLEQSQIASEAPPLIGEVLGWVARHGEQAGPMFFNYTAMRGSTMDIEVGAPTTTLLEGDGRVVTGTLPAGRYATVTYIGPYDGLHGAHEALHQWLAARDTGPVDMAGEGMTLLEIYDTDPDEEPDPQNWITHIAFRLGD